MVRCLGYICAIILACQSRVAIGEKIYRHSFSATPRTLDTTSYADLYADKLATLVYDSLYEYRYLKISPELKPRLAAAMPQISSDGLTIRIPIKKGVYFADDACFPKGIGREVVAEDFVYSLKRHFDPKEFSWNRWFWKDKIVGLDEWGAAGADYSKAIAGLMAIDRYTIQIQLKDPYPQFMYTLVTGASGVVPHEAITYYGKGIATHPVGSGAWKILSYDHRKAVFVRNLKYRAEFFDPIAEGYEKATHGFTGILKLAGKKLPIVDRIEVSFIEQNTSRWNSFTKGNEIQFGSIPPPEFSRIVQTQKPPTLRKDYADRYFINKEAEPAFFYLGFNMQHPDIGQHKDPVRNARNRALRCAIGKGFHWKQLIDRTYYGLGEPFPGIVPPEIEGFDKKLSRNSVTLDIAGAKKILKDNGWTAETLPVLRFAGQASLEFKQIFDMFKSWMVAIGYPSSKIKFDTFATFGDFIKALHSGKLMTFWLLWNFDYRDAQNAYQLYYGPNASPGSNTTNYQNPEYDRLYKESISLQSGPEREKIYRQLTQILLEDCATVSGFGRVNFHLWHKNVIMYPREYLHGDLFKYVDVQ